MPPMIVPIPISMVDLPDGVERDDRVRPMVERGPDPDTEVSQIRSSLLSAAVPRSSFVDAGVRAADIGSFPLATHPLAQYEDRLTFRFEPSGEREGAIVYAWEHTMLAIPLAHR